MRHLRLFKIKKIFTNLRLYEEMEREPQVGDYVHVKDQAAHDNQHMLQYFNNNVGEIVPYPYLISFLDVPESIEKYFTNKSFRDFSSEEILYFSKNKEDVETYIQTTKFNL